MTHHDANLAVHRLIEAAAAYERCPREENHQRRKELNAARKVVMDALCGEAVAASDRFDCARVVAT